MNGRPYVHAEVDDVEPGDVEHRGDDVLADVVDVALHGADDDDTQLLLRSRADQVRLQLRGDTRHDLAGHDELGDEGLAAGEALPDHVHGRLAVGEDADRVGAFRQQAVDHRQGIVFPQVDDGLCQLLCHSSSLVVPAGMSPFMPPIASVSSFDMRTSQQWLSVCPRRPRPCSAPQAPERARRPCQHQAHNV